MKTIAVIGAGVTGVTTAFVLSELGYKVTVFEKQLTDQLSVFPKIELVS